MTNEERLQKWFDELRAIHHANLDVNSQLARTAEIGLAIARELDARQGYINYLLAENEKLNALVIAPIGKVN